MPAAEGGVALRRRQFITLLGCGAMWPLVARAQRSGPAVIGVLSPEGSNTGNVEGLVQGLREFGYVEGRNIRFEYRWAEGKFDRLADPCGRLSTFAGRCNRHVRHSGNG